ncbi:VOC family protein [Herbiconiux sp. L3-i23]|uniref:VOC family protein n=1 Tax=Herbiconiux sp. L3-i23 TaxID=2905871 RepID=UPI0020503070|nr:VOC family protein [Herbiconiux sp. L3-i23]BDI22509.1 putative glyoxylase CFP32 [Herbiconiux sp. L3-i23]
MTTPPHTYPTGVPSWIDLERVDTRAATTFYSAVLGWEFTVATPPGVEPQYLVATLDGADAAAISGPTEADSQWNTYIAVDDVETYEKKVEAAGGSVLVPAQDIGPAGRLAVCADPAGAEFRLWQAKNRLGVQVTNIPGAWNFSILDTPDPRAALQFYSAVFGWTSIGSDSALGDLMVAQPGYGQHLTDTVDPDIFERQVGAPEGFADVVAGIGPSIDGEPARWRVQFSVEDREAAIASATELGATVVSTRETDWTHEALIRDPAGAVFTASQFVRA